jgi:hypothetical protein
MFNTRAEVVEAYRMERDGRANVIKLASFNHPNVVNGDNSIPAALTRETTVRRINQWGRPLVEGESGGGDCFELATYLAGSVAMDQSGRDYPPLMPGCYKIMDPALSYMVLGQYPSQGSTQLISKEWIARARSRWDTYVLEHGEKSPAGTSGAMGLGVAEYGTDVNATCC